MVTVRDALATIGGELRYAEELALTAEAERDGLRERLAECRHALTTYQGLWAHDGDPAQAWQLDDADLIRRIDTHLV